MCIATVSAVTSKGSILEETAVGAITAGCRAIETRPADLPRLEIEVVAEPGLEEFSETLAHEIELSRFLTSAQGTGVPSMTVYLLAARDPAEKETLLPHLGPLPRACYAVLGEEGELVMPVRPLGRHLALLDLVENLEDRFRWLHTLALRNPGADALEGTVSFEILRREAGGSWAAAQHRAVFEDGEPFAFEITNRSNRPLHVYVIDFAVDGEIQLIYPPRGSWQPLPPQGQACVGQARPGQDDVSLLFEIHPELPFDGSSGPVEVEETLKLIATTEATDFYQLFQKSYRQFSPGPEPSSSSLSRLLYRTFWGLTTREVGRGGEGRAEELWSTVDRTVRISGRGPASNDQEEES